MREILELCATLDRFAFGVYETMADTCSNPELATVFRQLSREESAHVSWWEDLLSAWNQGLIPDAFSDDPTLLQSLRTIEHELSFTKPEDYSGLDPETMLEVAARVEFFMLDPLFAELLELTEPTGATAHREAYGRHVERLVRAIEVHYHRADLATFLARVLRRAWHDNMALAALANRDPLTALLNRRGMFTQLKQWLSWSQRYHRPIAVVAVDLDRLKHINDTFGHAGGDAAIRAVGRALAASTRSSDVIARVGGDEFVVLAPETDADELNTLMQRIVDVSRSIDVEIPGAPDATLSVSVGGAVACSDSTADDVTPEMVLKAADASLYEAKSNGRNQRGPVMRLGTV